MKLAFLAPEFLPTWGGVGTYSVELIRNLCKGKDIEVHVITPKRGKTYDSAIISKFFDDRIILHNISNANDTFFYNFNFQISLLKNFDLLNKKYKFDLIHAANLVHMPDIYLKFKKLNLPSITTAHTTLRSQDSVNGQRLRNNFNTTSTVEKLTKLYYPYISFLEKIYLKRTKYFIAVSNWIKNFIDKNNTIEDIRVIHNGVDVNKFSTKNKKSEEFGFLKDIGKPIVLYCGRLMAIKGIGVLIQTIKDILKKEDLYFVFAGAGDISKWEKLLDNTSKDNYKFLNYVDYEKIHYLYSKADIFVLPSFTESFPLSILEAMSSGVPVIATNVGGVSEIITNKKDGILIEPGNSEYLTSSILYLLNNREITKKITSKARKKIEVNFNSKIMAKKTKKFYQDILSVGG